MEPNEEDVVDDDDEEEEEEGEVDSGADDDELLVPKSPIPEEIRSCDGDGSDGEDEEDGRQSMEKVFAKVMDLEEEDEEDDDPPTLPPTLPPLIVTDETGNSSSQPVIRPVPGITMTSLVYAPRPYSAPKKISPP